MTKIERLFPAFGIIFAVVYAYVLYNDLPLATHPRLGVWGWGRQASITGSRASYCVRLSFPYYGVVVADSVDKRHRSPGQGWPVTSRLAFSRMGATVPCVAEQLPLGGTTSTGAVHIDMIGHRR